MKLPQVIKILLVITGVLAGSVIAYTWLQRPRHPQAPYASAVDAADKITLQTGPAQIELARNGPAWEVRASSGAARYKADGERVARLQKALRELQLEDVISERRESAAEFQVSLESGTAITLFDKGGKATTGLIGKQAPDLSHLYFKFPDQPQVYLARGAMRADLGVYDVKAWRDRSLFDVAEDQVITVFIEGPGFKTGLARSSDTWSCNGKEVDPAHVWGTLGVLAHLKAEDFVDPAQTPGPPPERLSYASLTLQLKNGATHQLNIGPLDSKTQRRIVMADKAAGAAWISETTVKTILQKPSDFSPRHPRESGGPRASP